MMSSTRIVRTAVALKPGLGLGLGLKNLVLFTSLVFPRLLASLTVAIERPFAVR